MIYKKVAKIAEVNTVGESWDCLRTLCWDLFLRIL